ncbi:MAG: hypothetical protein EBZ40_10080 [Gammaproteobacteria bacterium]|nr:hypothetical protein [Gammaproteobacteria bacterium]
MSPPVNTIVALCVVVFMIVLLGWMARGMRGLVRRSDGALRVVDEVGLGPKQRLVLVEVNGAPLLLGVSDAGIARLDGKETACRGE